MRCWIDLFSYGIGDLARKRGWVASQKGGGAVEMLCSAECSMHKWQQECDVWVAVLTKLKWTHRDEVIAAGKCTAACFVVDIEHL